tara:strand:- start:6386 stop:6547 length:162 start_codon:yes stop_codon:yes gene_type:complete
MNKEMKMKKIIKLINKVYNNSEKTDAIVYDKYILINALAEELKKECQLQMEDK